MKKWYSYVAVALLTVPLLFNWQAHEVLKLKTFDAFVQIPEPSGWFVTLDITEDDVAAAGGWPYPRQDLARIQLDLLEAGALGVCLLYTSPSPRDS